jgi:diacylglycerol kinase family enzyme
VTIEKLPDLVGADAEPFDLRFVGSSVKEYASAQLILISNNPYQLTQLGGRATRENMDTGSLGLVALRIDNPAHAAELATLELASQAHRFSGLRQWTATDSAVDSSEPVDASVDGEALILTPPLRLESMPGALRIRRPRHAHGYSPAAVAAETRPSIANVKRLARILVSGGLAP